MKKIILSAFLFAGALCLSAQLKEIPPNASFADQCTILDGSSSVEQAKIATNKNAEITLNGNVEITIDGKVVKVLELRASVKDQSNHQDRYFAATIPIKADDIKDATHLVIECGAKDWVNGAWGPLSFFVSDKGAWYGGGIYKNFKNQKGLIQTYAVDLKNSEGKFYTGKGSALHELRITGNATHNPNSLYIRKIYTAKMIEATSRTITARPVTEPAKLKIYPNGSTVEFEIKGGNGTPAEKDTLQWTLADFLDKTVDSGKVEFGPEQWKDGLKLEFNGKKYPAGFYYLRVALTSDGATVPWNGTRPEGFETFGFLPPIEAFPIEFADQSRFGAQGTNYLYKRDPLNPLYNVMGIRWVYENARPIWAEPTPDKQFAIKTDKELEYNKKGRIAVNQYAYLISMLGAPPHMLKLPSYVTPEQARKDIARLAQAYPLKDPTAYTALVEKLMDQEARKRKIAMPHMSRNYYEMHWEPDWHWRGTDEEFIEYYSCARQAMDKADPTAILTAANYGVIDVGTDKLEKLFKKGLAKHINGITTHLYLMKAGWPEAAGLDQECRRLRRLTDKYLGKNAPIYQTEGGTKVSGSPRKPEILRNHLGIFLRGHLIALGEGFDSTWFFYTADHDNMNKKDAAATDYGMFFNMDSNGRVFGADEVAPKPTALGVAAMTRLLEGTKTLGRLDYFGEGVYVYAFMRDDKIIHALWAPFGDKKIALEVGINPVTIYDVMGNPRTATPVGEKLELTLNDLPFYIVGADPRTVPNQEILAAVVGTAFPYSPVSQKKMLLERGGKQIPIEKGAILSPELSSGIYLLAERDSSGQLRSARLLELEGATKITGITADKNGFQVTCTNRSAEVQKYTLNGFFLRKQEKHGFSKEISLKGNETKTVTIPYEESGYDPLYGIPSWTFELRRKLPIALESASSLRSSKLASNQSETFDSPLSAVPTNSNQTRNLLKLEADSSAIGSQGELCAKEPFVWGGATANAVAEFSRFYGKEAINYQQGKWKGMDDFSFRYKLAEEKDSVRLSVEIKDDVAYRKLYDKGLWRTDSVVAAFGSGRDPGNEWNRHRIFMIRLNEKNEAEAGELIGVPAGEFVPVEGLSAKVVRDENTKITSYELTVPFQLFGDPAAIRQDGSFGFGLSVHDVDSAEEAEKDTHRAAGFYGGAPFFMQSMKFGTIYLK